MKRTVVVGIVFSKRTLDVSYFIVGAMQDYNHRQFSNTEQGCLELIA